ncbi:MAG: acetyl/propionyl/methylcrotonyl-CoA carboxylase subunit alpha [Alphaproteobacteria bacterium]|nr:acetyl/propionyl/methylcrotonyl-CoA carboxylase subunit alpha [Alphaproteobacteria bacterium]
MQNNKLFDKVLVANRGEIAVRIIKTLRKLNIKSVAVFSESDTNAVHVNLADEAVFIGNSPATDSYLCIDHIISAIRKSGAQAVHPGYGFLSENSEFAKALKKEGVELIGPSASSIKSMGDKIEAKKIADKAKVSTVPGYMGVIPDYNKAIKIAKKIGFPVIVKAAAGGGGRGMRVVHNEDDMKHAFISASNEARNSFSDERVFIEKYIVSPRHIEIQILADKHGNAVTLGERECSIQRHHQKVIEEAPSPFISDKTRKLMCKQSLKLVESMGYYSAGTVEFIVDKNQNFYFMEMNTRIQVEHCVTELVYDVDLVEHMIRVAAGQKLALNQEDLKVNGWAIESRICAEDPTRGFLPSSGRITSYQEPPKNSLVRVDSGIAEGGEVSMFYDQMIAKLCTHAPTREQAIEVMNQSLDEYTILGIAHNIPFLQSIMQHPKFIRGDVATTFIDEEYPDGFLGEEITSEITQIFIGAAIHIHMTEAVRAASITGTNEDQYKKVGTRWIVNIDGSFFPVIIKPVEGGYNIRHESDRILVRSDWPIGSKIFRCSVNNISAAISIKYVNNGYVLNYAAREAEVRVISPRIAELEQFMPKRQEITDQQNMIAPLSGKISQIFVEKGQSVKQGEKLFVIEAMKMENTICATKEAMIEDIHVKEGDSITTNQLMISFAEKVTEDA